MSFAATRWAWSQQTLRPLQKLVLLNLADRANEQNVCWPSIRRIMLDTGISNKRTLIAAIRTIESLGLLHVLRSQGQHSVYTLMVLPQMQSNSHDTQNQAIHSQNTSDTYSQNSAPQNLAQSSSCRNQGQDCKNPSHLYKGASKQGINTKKGCTCSTVATPPVSKKPPLPVAHAPPQAVAKPPHKPIIQSEHKPIIEACSTNAQLEAEGVCHEQSVHKDCSKVHDVNEKTFIQNEEAIPDSMSTFLPTVQASPPKASSSLAFDLLPSSDDLLFSPVKAKSSHALQHKGSLQTQQPVRHLPLHLGAMHSITSHDMNEWQQLYPCVNLEQELRKMKGWLVANPERRKTKRDIARFIHSWLAKAQDAADKAGRPTARTQWQKDRQDFENLAAAILQHDMQAKP